MGRSTTFVPARGRLSGRAGFGIGLVVGAGAVGLGLGAWGARLSAGLGRAEARVEASAAHAERRLHEAHPGLKRYEEGVPLEGDRYVESIEVRGGRASIRLTNDGDRPVTPGVAIHFLDADGFATGTASVRWLLATIGPGETRVEAPGLRFRFGPPTYYLLDFTD